MDTYRLLIRVTRDEERVFHASDFKEAEKLAAGICKVFDVNTGTSAPTEVVELEKI